MYRTVTGLLCLIAAVSMSVAIFKGWHVLAVVYAVVAFLFYVKLERDTFR